MNQATSKDSQTDDGRGEVREVRKEMKVYKVETQHVEGEGKSAYESADMAYFIIQEPFHVALEGTGLSTLFSYTQKLGLKQIQIKDGDMRIRREKNLNWTIYLAGSKFEAVFGNHFQFSIIYWTFWESHPDQSFSSCKWNDSL